MSAAAAEPPRLVHSVPGRVRLHLPSLSGHPHRHIEAHLRRVPGVRSAQGNPLTGNVLIRFDPDATNERTLLAAAEAVEPATTAAGKDVQEPAPPPALRERHGPALRARIALRGLDRDPGLGLRVVEHLERRPGVRRASASRITGRVLVEYAEQEVALDDLIAEVALLELPALAGEDRPAHPLESGPLVRSASRAIGASLGLGLLAVRRLVSGGGVPSGTDAPAVAAGAIGLLQAFPAVRDGLGRLVGPEVVDAGFGVAGVVALTLAGSPLGLALVGLEALRLFTAAWAQRAAWCRYEERGGDPASVQPGAVLRLEAGERTPLEARIRDGVGTAAGADGLPVAVAPGSRIPAGAPLYGGPFVLELQGGEPFTSRPRPNPVAEAVHDRYVRALGPLSLAYMAATAVLTRSPSRTFAALLLVNPRPALIGRQAADAGAAARVVRAGATVVGTRPDRPVRLPGVLLLHGPRVLTDGFELALVVPLPEAGDGAEVRERAIGIAEAAGSPWGNAFPIGGSLAATDGAFDGRTATASVEGARYSLGPIADGDPVPAAVRLRHRGDRLLLLRREDTQRPLGLLVLRPRLAQGVGELIQACRRHRVALELLTAGDPLAARGVAERADVPVVDGDDPVAAVRARQVGGRLVAFASDSADAAAAFAACDLAIGLEPGNGHLPARADLLAHDLGTIAAIVAAGAHREASVRDAVGLSAIGNGFGAVWGLAGGPGIARAGYASTVSALAALGLSWVRLRGGARPRAATLGLTDPQPERWGRRETADVLRALDTTDEGLDGAEAARRRRVVVPVPERNRLWAAVLDQIRSPLTGVLAAGAGLSLVLGAPADVAMIGAMIVANAAAGAWQEARANQAAEALVRMGTVTTRALRDGVAAGVPADELVPGDVILLVAGDRVGADARLLEAQGLEVDEAALSGESVPVPKAPDGPTDGSRVVLEGSDVVAGTARAVVVAVGQGTRIGAMAAALAVEETRQSPLGLRLNRLLRQVLPLAAAGGGIVAASGTLRGGTLLGQVAAGASIAVAAVPEGLPLLAKIGEAAVGRRLAGRQALVHRLAAVEALGRVDVACTDKTGTMTEGRLRLRLVTDLDREEGLSGALPAGPRRVLLTAALAGPHPDALDAATDRTDAVVAQAAEEAGLSGELRLPREGRLAFDSARSFHAALAQGRLCVEGAAEALVPRCAWASREGGRVVLDQAGRDELLARAERLSERGLRVLMVAEGAPDGAVDDPRGLVALGFLGLSDPLRPGVPAAVRRCHEAGIRVVMLTGDHPATARAIGGEAGLPTADEGIITGAEIAAFDDAELDRRLARAAIVARATPLDKLRIVESLQRLGHTVAMTGDGINDAPALRLADVGVAMGLSGTEVARQAADVVLADDDFSTLVETFVEGRSFWRNIRRALGLLLGGNLGELGLQVGASVVGLASPLTSRQILTVNLITDVLPALAVALQQPEHHNLAGLAREGTAALDAPLRNEILRRGAATAAPSFAAYLLTLRAGGLPAARTVAFASIVATQLAQTLDVGWAERGPSRSVLGAVVASTGLLIGTLVVPPLRTFLGLALPTPLGLALVGGGALIAVVLSRTLNASGLARGGARPFPAPAGLGA